MAEQWVKAGKISDIPEGLGHRVKLDGLDIALFRLGRSVYALEDFCPHLGFPLSEGIVRDDEVICAWHGWHVRLADGGCLSERNKAKTYPVEVRGDEVWVLAL